MCCSIDNRAGCRNASATYLVPYTTFVERLFLLRLKPSRCRLCNQQTWATAMVAYGMFKISPSQFPAPGLSRLVQPYGDSSPMGLLWTFMGVSMAREENPSTFLLANRGFHWINEFPFNR